MTDTEQQPHDSQPVRVRSKEMPESLAEKPPVWIEMSGSKRGGSNVGSPSIKLILKGVALLK